MSLHHKLTVDHFQLDPASKKRNHLAEDVLDRNMLALMKVFFSSKGMHSVFCQSKIIIKKRFVHNFLKRLTGTTSNCILIVGTSINFLNSIYMSD